MCQALPLKNVFSLFIHLFVSGIVLGIKYSEARQICPCSSGVLSLAGHYDGLGPAVGLLTLDKNVCVAIVSESC